MPGEFTNWKIVYSFDEMRAEIRTAGTALTGKADDMGLPSHGGNLLWYRGCPSSKHTLLPSLLRPPSGLQEEMAMYDEYSGRFLLEGWHALFDMQHYSAPTRLLDWTTNPDVALYFALAGDGLSDPSVWVMQPCILNARTLEPPESRPFSLRRFRFRDRGFEYPAQCGPGGKILHDLPLAVLPAPFIPDDLLMIHKPDAQQTIQHLAGEHRGVPNVGHL